MKETVLQNAPKVMYVRIRTSRHAYTDGASSKKLQFGTLTAQDVVRISEFQVTHRDLYTTTDRAPVKDGVLDRRLVSLYVCLYVLQRCEPCAFRVRRRRIPSVRHVGSTRSTVSVTTPISSSSSPSFISGISSTQSPYFSAYARYVSNLPLQHPFFTFFRHALACCWKSRTDECILESSAARTLKIFSASRSLKP